MSPLSRRRFIRTATGLAIGLVAGCGTRPKVDLDADPATGPFAGRELRVCVDGGHEKAVREAFVPAFEKQTGAKVTLTVAADAVGKLKDAKGKDPPFDLLLTDAVRGHPAAREGLFAKLDLANVPNHKALAA